LIANLILRDRFCTHWESFLPKEVFDRLWRKLAPSHELRNPDPKFYFYAAATFDHENLQKNAGQLHDWLTRRWNGFNVNVNSAVGLGLALSIALPLGIDESPFWFLYVGLLLGVFLVSAAIAWYETMMMLEFHSYRP
jgi:hypothetical protein